METSGFNALMKPQEDHHRTTIDQFTKQAEPFAKMAEHSDEDAMRMLIAAAEIRKDDLVLDLACGPGLVACAMAPQALEVTGVDIAPAMIALAQRTQEERGLGNLRWQVSTVEALPFAEDTFSLVVSRYAFHHFLDPLKVLAEMKRVCRIDGRILICDVTPAPECQDAYDAVERLRDPSHARALTRIEFQDLFRQAEIQITSISSYGLKVNLEKLLSNSFPNPGGADEVRRIFSEDISTENNALGVKAHREDGEIYFTFPITIITGRAS